MSRRPGFGKSTLVRQLLDGVPAVAVCDCRGVTSDVDLARRLIPALADENPERSGSLSQSETMIGDGHTSAADRVGVALAAWRVRTHASAFVFENTEDAIGDPGARDFLAKLLANRPDARTIVICSRESLRMHLSRFAPPHQILSLRAADLAFTPEEIRAIFAGTGASAAAVERVASISAGWPIAVLLLARFAHEGRLDPLLDKLDDVAYEELHEYLADQVLGDAEPAVIDGLLDVRGDPASRRARRAPRARRRRGVRDVPRLHEDLAVRQPQRRRHVRGASAGRARRCSSGIRRASTRCSRRPPPRTRRPTSTSARRRSISRAATRSPRPKRSSTSR